MVRFLRVLCLAVSPLICAHSLLAEEVPQEAAKVEFFEKKIRPILVDNCYGCHSADTNSKGGLRVDDRNGLLNGGGMGAAIVPGDPDNSLMIQAVSHTADDLKMPPKKKLSDEQIADLTKWVLDGAAWPAVQNAIDLKQPNEKYEKLKKEHWAWQPLTSPTVPAVNDATWPKDDIDRFVLHRLEQQGLRPVGDADKVTLLRRVTFDLIGLPPLPDDIDAFVNDSSPDAFNKVVERLLASSAFGERWARRWLDVARYGESTGPSRNIPFPHAWRYRDYVIHAFQTDKPYDQFLREQIAGDLLPAASAEQREEQIVATGFLAVGGKDVNQRFKVRFTMDNIDEQIDTVSRAILGLTVSCARCHDHKFDPIPTVDYYALAGIFHSTDLCAGVRNKMGGGGLDYYDSSMLIVLQANEGTAGEAKIAELKQALEVARKEFQTLRDSPTGAELGPDGKPKRATARQKMNKLQAELTAASDPAANGGRVAMGVREGQKIGDTEVRIRGEAEKLGPIVPRGFLGLVSIPDAAPVNTQQSGRLELANWLANVKNPLTSRVIVNRVWQHLFGQGLVRSVDNFGVTGDVPSHPELLDHLARRFIAEGWSIKKLVRAIVLTRAYQLSSDATAELKGIDPANRLIWRHSPRRLDAEEIRDATLVAAGQLNLSAPAASPAKDFKVIEMPNNGPQARGLAESARLSKHRSVYLPLLRDLVPNSLLVFDFAEQGFVTGSRDTTTVAPQALYMLNDPFVRRQSLNLAERILNQTELDDAARVTLAYRLTFGRQPTSSELDRATHYLADYEAANSELVASTPTAEKPAQSESPAIAQSPTGGAVKKPVVIDPDAVIQADAPVKEEVIRAANPRTAAWASFCQALIGSAEFRYLR